MKPLNRWVEDVFVVYGTAVIRAVTYLLAEVAALWVLSKFGFHVLDDSRLALSCCIIGFTFGVAHGRYRCGVVPKVEQVE